jgi:hypothetical protein
MIRNIPEPTISPAFTIEDIHKIREWNYEVLKDATPQERANYYKAGTQEFMALIENTRRMKKQSDSLAPV